jgi:mannose-6-phosphate isomerase-like protein (cupin superfamily)
MSSFFDWQNLTGKSEEKFYKMTMWQGQHVTVGMNCLEPGQSQPSHTHGDADKFYLVLEGRGRFIVGDEERDAGTGTIVTAPAGVTHGVSNSGETRLSLLVAIAPPIKNKSTGAGEK